MNVARLIIAIGADAGDLRRDLARSNAILQQFARTATANIKTSNVFGPLTTGALHAANTVVQRLRQGFARAALASRDQLARGLISPEQFRQQGGAAADAFNAGLRQGMNDLHAVGLLTPRVRAGIISQMKQTGAQAAVAFQQEMNAKLGVMGAGMARVGRQATTHLTLPILIGLGAALKAAGNFEQSLLRMQGALRITAAEAQVLGEAAREMAGAFTATDIAAGQLALGKAGLDVNTVLGAMPAVINLALASELELADASEVAAKAMTQFALGAGDLVRISDAVVVAANKSTTDVRDLAQAFTYAGGVAKRSGVNIEQTAAAMALMANAGIEASRAGTSLTGILIRLADVDPPKPLADLKLKGTRDGVIDLVEVIRQLEIGGKRTGEVVKALGLRAGPALDALLGQGSQALADMTEQIRAGGGASQDFADTVTQGLYGSLRRLKAAAVELSISLGESGLIDMFTGLFRGLASLLRVLGQTSPAFLKLVTGTLLLAAAMGPLLFVVGNLTRAYSFFRGVLLATRAAQVATAASTLALQGATTGAAIGVGTLAGASGLGALGALLLPGGIILGGLALAGGLIYLLGRRAAAARQETEAFNTALAGLTLPQLKLNAGDLFKSVNEAARATQAAQRRLEAARARAAGDRGAGGVIAAAQRDLQARQAIEDQLRARLEQTNKVRVDRLKLEQQVADIVEIPEPPESPDPEAGAERLRLMREEVSNLIAALDISIERELAAGEILDRLQQKHAAITAEIVANGGAQATANQELVRMQQELDLAITTAPLRALQVRMEQIRAILAQASALPEGSTVAADLRGQASQQLAALERGVTTELRNQGEVHAANRQIVDDTVKLLKDVRELGAQQVQIALPLPTFDARETFRPSLALLSEAAERFALARDQLQLAIAAGDQAVADKARAQLEALREQLEITRAVFARRVLQTPGLNAEQMAAAIAAADAAMQKFGVSTADVTEETGNLLDAIASVAIALQGILSAGNAFGDIGDDAQAAISSLIGLVQAIREIQKAKEAAAAAGKDLGLEALPGIIGAAGAAIGLLGSLFGGGGPDPREVLLRENNEQLERLRIELGKNIDAVSRLASAQAAIARLDLGRINAIDAGGFAKDLTSRLRIEEVNRQIASFGLTFADLQQIAAQNGISLLDEKGRLVTDALQQLYEIIGLNLESLRRFGATVDDQRARIDARNRIFNVEETPQQQIADTRELLAQFSPAVLQRLFQGIDISTTQGLAQLRARLQQLFTDIEASGATLDQLGDFASLEELIQAMLDLDEAMDELARNATGFADTLADQRRRLELRDALAGGENGPAQAVQRELELLSQFAPAIAQMFASVDTSTAAGRVAFRDMLKNLFNLIDAGFVGPLLGDLGIEDLLDILGILTGSLNEMEGVVNEVNRSMANIPEGFRQAFLELTSQDPRSQFGGDTPIPILPPPLPSGGFNLTLAEGAIQVNGVNKDPSQVASETLAQLKRKAQASGLQPQQWPLL